MSFHAVAIDKVFKTAREHRGPYATWDAAKTGCDQLRTLYKSIPASRGSLAKTLADECDFQIIGNVDHTTDTGRAA